MKRTLSPIINSAGVGELIFEFVSDSPASIRYSYPAGYKSSKVSSQGVKVGPRLLWMEFELISYCCPSHTAALTESSIS